MSDTQVYLEPQPHGGAIRRGNPPPPGNWPGGGRPKDSFRAKCRELASANVKTVAEIAAGTLSIGGKLPKHSDVIAANDLLMRAGHGEAKVSTPDNFEPALFSLLTIIYELAEKARDLGATNEDGSAIDPEQIMQDAKGVAMTIIEDSTAG